MALDREVKYYEANKKDLLKKHNGKFVLIKGDRLVGSFDSEKSAYEAGLKEFGNQAFLIKRVSKKEDTSQNPALVLGIL